MSGLLLTKTLKALNPICAISDDQIYDIPYPANFNICSMKASLYSLWFQSCSFCISGITMCKQLLPCGDSSKSRFACGWFDSRIFHHHGPLLILLLFPQPENSLQFHLRCLLSIYEKWEDHTVTITTLWNHFYRKIVSFPQLLHVTIVLDFESLSKPECVQCRTINFMCKAFEACSASRE